MSLDRYHARRDFSRTSEPRGDPAAGGGRLFVVQMHKARRLHFDLRLEHGGVLRSWAVPKGPSLDPADKRLAVETEDHPLQYGDFEGVIPRKAYGAGTMMVWDSGQWEPCEDVDDGFRRGHLKFRLHGRKLGGLWTLVRRGGDADAPQWLLIKDDDGAARPGEGTAMLRADARSVKTGRNIDQIARDEPSTLLQDEIEPEILTPTLASVAAAVPDGADWLHEVKYDGYRLLCRLSSGRVQLLTRAGNDWTARFAVVAEAAALLSTKDAVLDGEVVALRANGTSDFQTLQNALRDGASARLVYYVFDLLRLDGRDLTSAPLLERKRALSALIGESPRQRLVRYSDHVEGQGPAFFRQACDSGLEGILSKRSDSPYAGRRTRDWLKIKCGRRQEFVIGGFTEPAGSRQGFGSLLLGVFEGRQLRYAGKVGTGFSTEQLRDVAARLQPLRRDTPAFAQRPPRTVDGRRVHWVEPRLVAEIRFAEWTQDQRLRLPVFLGLREDKRAADVVREAAAPPPRASRENAMTQIKLTHPDRVLYPEQGITKAQLAEYYARQARWIFPHVGDRPLSLVRCPRGESGQCFYQKHLGDEAPKGVEAVEITEQNGKRAAYIVIRDEVGLISLAQMGALEVHPWGARADRPERPDRLIMDLDPGEGVGWPQVIQAAWEMKALLERTGLTSFPKTTGGKGLHVVVPLQRRQSWDELREFAAGLAQYFADKEPKRFVATMTKSKRRGRIFLDYFRNGRGATAIAPYSTRAKAQAPIATPVSWDELDAVESSKAFTLETLPRRLEELRGDPWEGFFDLRQSIGAEQRRRLK